MKSHAKRFMRFWSEERSLTVFLLLLIVEIFVIAPIYRTGIAIGLFNNIFFSALLLVGLLTMTHQKALQAVVTIFVVLAVATHWARLVFGVTGLEILDGLLMLACVTGFLAIVLWQVYREGPVTMHRIQGAVAGYLLLSLCFAIAYGLLEYMIQGSFQLPKAGGQNDTLMNRSFYYFSVVTLTTTGYGDILPLSPYARTLVMMEALVGQLYPAILIARLVSLHAETKREKRRENK